MLRKFDLAITRISLVLLAFVSAPAWALCNNPSLSPSSVISNPAGGSSGPQSVVTPINITVTCNTRNETFSITVDSEAFTSSVGTDPDIRVALRFYKDSARQEPIFSSSVAGKYTSGGVGTITTTIYAELVGQYKNEIGTWTNTWLLGNGNFNVSASGKVTSGASVSAFNFNQSGAVVATCSVNNSSVDFGTFKSGTSPEAPVTFSVQCTQGATYKVSQPSATPVVISGQNKGYAYVIAPSGIALVDQPITNKAGPGFATPYSFPSKVKIEGMTRGSPIVGAGSFTTVIPIQVTY